MKMAQQQFRIGQLAKQLDVEKFVIRFWEKEFNIKPNRSEGGQRFYTPKDLQAFKEIKSLLHEQGFTIAGAKKLLKTKKPHEIVASHTTTIDEPTIQELYKDLIAFKKRLHQLRLLLS